MKSSTGNRGWPPESRAARLESIVETNLVDDHGRVRSALNIDTMQPFAKGFFDHLDVHHYPGENWTDFSDYISYENVGMCSGAYLAAMVWKYRATRDSVALDTARRTFHAICGLFDMSQAVDEGFYCKCYGGKLSDQISSDQYIYTFVGLDLFLEHATSAERRVCVAMIGKMVKFWMRRNYFYPYFGQPLHWPLERFPVFAWLAWQHTGREEFRDEFARLCELPEVNTVLPFAALRWDELLAETKQRPPAFDFEKGTNQRLIRLNPETTESGFISLAALLAYQAPHRELWLDKVRHLYDMGQRWIAEDGYALGPHLYDLQTGKLAEVRQVLATGAGSGGWKFLGFVGWIRSGMWSAMFARAAVGIQDYFPEIGALDLAGRILSQLDQNKLRWFVDMDGRQFPEDMRWIGRVFSGDAVTHWLWAYWEARGRWKIPV